MPLQEFMQHLSTLDPITRVLLVILLAVVLLALKVSFKASS